MDTQPSGVMELKRACMEGDLPKVKELLNRQNVNHKVPHMLGQTTSLLHLAALCGHQKVVGHLLKFGADMSVRDHTGDTALHYAAQKGHTQVVRLLVMKGADVFLEGNHQKTALHAAAQSDHIDTLDYLLDVGQINVVALDKDNRTPLHRASMNNHSRSVKRLIENGSNVNAKDASQNTPLHLAVKGGKLKNEIDTVQVLLRNGADRTAINIKKKRALDVAHPRLKLIIALSQPSLDGDKECIYININIKPADPELVRRVLNNPEDCYKMSAKPRGRAIILNNEIFGKSAEAQLSDREGSSVDLVNLSNLFDNLGFDTKRWINLSADEVKREINNERQSAFHKNADAFVFVVLSHGCEGAIYGTDNQTVEITRDIIDMFDGNNCPQLIAKPKLFFIQSCQGKQVTPGVFHSSTINATPSRNREEEADDDNFPVRNSVHEKADVLVYSAAVPGYKSWRDTDTGSWFIRDLVENINRHAHTLHLSDILVKVNNQTSKREGMYKRYKQISKLESTLTKLVFFLPET